MKSTKVTARPPAPAPTTLRGDSAAGVQRARQATRAFADSLTPPPDPATADTLVLVVSELVTNALRHGGGRYTLQLTAGSETLDVAVNDPSPASPQERAPDLNEGGGFGWNLVRHLTHALTITHDTGPGHGKTIHARILR
ncbi:ATP-binding protein [Streptomyces sp. NPDC053542]|uniref:ATP-binding protein n=1 Tax=Streptomyces sp. NPDC053542 TaxID=3365710 RepID=UPI0037D35A5B